jgi:hypothetical protein
LLDQRFQLFPLEGTRGIASKQLRPGMKRSLIPVSRHTSPNSHAVLGLQYERDLRLAVFDLFIIRSVSPTFRS